MHDPDGAQDGAGQRQHHVPDLLEVVGPVNFRRLKQVLRNIGNEVAQHEDAEDLAARRPHDDKGRQGVEQVQVAQQDEQRHQVGNGRHHHQEQDGVPQEVGERHAQAGEEVRTAQGKEQGEQGRAGGNEKAVGHRGGDGIPGGPPVLPVHGLGQRSGRDVELLVVLHADDDHQVEGQEGENKNEPDEGMLETPERPLAGDPTRAVQRVGFASKGPVLRTHPVHVTATLGQKPSNGRKNGREWDGGQGKNEAHPDHVGGALPAGPGQDAHADGPSGQADQGLLPGRKRGPPHQQAAQLLQAQHDDGQDDTDGASRAHFLGQEGFAEHEQRGHGGLAAGAAFQPGQGQDHARILDGIYDDKHQQEIDGTHDERQLDLGELAEPVDAVNLARLVDILADALQLGQMGQHGEGAYPREAPDDARGDDQAGIAQPGRHLPFHEDAAPAKRLVEVLQNAKQAGAHDELVQVARRGFKEEGTPDQHHNQAGDDHGHHKQGAVQEVHPLALAAVDAHGHEQGRNHLHHIPSAEDEGQAEGIPELGVLEQVKVVEEAHRFGNVRPVPAVEAVEDPASRRVVLEQTDQQQGGNDEEINLPVMPDLVPSDFFRCHKQSVEKWSIGVME